MRSIEHCVFRHVFSVSDASGHGKVTMLVVPQTRGFFSPKLFTFCSLRSWSMYYYTLCFAQLRICLVNSGLKRRLKVKICGAIQNWVSGGVTAARGCFNFSPFLGNSGVLPDSGRGGQSYNFFIATTPAMYGWVADRFNS